VTSASVSSDQRTGNLEIAGTPNSLALAAVVNASPALTAKKVRATVVLAWALAWGRSWPAPRWFPFQSPSS
jgi:hypothetical protein